MREKSYWILSKSVYLYHCVKAMADCAGLCIYWYQYQYQYLYLYLYLYRYILTHTLIPVPCIFRFFILWNLLRFSCFRFCEGFLFVKQEKPNIKFTIYGIKLHLWAAFKSKLGVFLSISVTYHRKCTLFSSYTPLSSGQSLLCFAEKTVCRGFENIYGLHKRVRTKVLHSWRGTYRQIAFKRGCRINE